MVVHKPDGWTFVYHISIDGAPPVLLGDLSPAKQEWAKRELSNRLARASGLEPTKENLRETEVLKKKWMEEEAGCKG